MKRFYVQALLAVTALLPCAASATEADMKKALDLWKLQTDEYAAALSAAESAGSTENLPAPPDGADVARDIWKSISGKTGERSKDGKKVPIYEYQAQWAAPGVAWMINHPDAFAKIFAGRQRQLSHFADQLLISVEELHYASPYIADACATFSASTSVRVYEILERIYMRNRDPQARASAALAMSIMLGNPLISSREGNNTLARSKRIYYLKQALNLAYPNSSFGNQPFDKVALEVTYNLKNLSTGCVPPRLRVQDTAGHRHLLPQPGKPTLILFWSPGDDTSISIVARGEELTKRYPGLQFCPVTMNCTEAEWAEISQQTNITATFMDDSMRTGMQAYRVAQFPTAVLVDDHCRILYAGYPNLQLQTALDGWYTEQEEEKEKSRPKVQITEREPIIQPGSRPTMTTPARPQPEEPSNEPPALREMPDFN